MALLSSSQVPQCGVPGGARARALWQEAVRVRGVPRRRLHQGPPRRPHAHPHRREAVHVPGKEEQIVRSSHLPSHFGLAY